MGELGIDFVLCTELVSALLQPAEGKWVCNLQVSSSQRITLTGINAIQAHFENKRRLSEPRGQGKSSSAFRLRFSHGKALEIDTLIRVLKTLASTIF